jgi:hypothetical protein
MGAVPAAPQNLLRSGEKIDHAAAGRLAATIGNKAAANLRDRRLRERRSHPVGGHVRGRRPRALALAVRPPTGVSNACARIA